jgi:hypothetical protein
MKAHFTAETPQNAEETQRKSISFLFSAPSLRTPRLGGEKVSRYHLFGYEQILAFAQDCSDKTIKLFSNKA